MLVRFLICISLFHDLFIENVQVVNFAAMLVAKRTTSVMVLKEIYSICKFLNDEIFLFYEYELNKNVNKLFTPRRFTYLIAKIMHGNI